MARLIDINADLGEGCGTDDALLDVVSSANVACGFHAGDAATMRAVCRSAAAKNVCVGAHPSFDDLGNFGRTVIRMSMDELESLVAYQIGLMGEAASEAGIALSHVKAHGALYNIASVDEDHALAIGRAIKAADPGLVYLGFAGSEMGKAADRLGLAFAAEAFPDRHYTDDGQLMARDQPLSVITDPEAVAERARRMIEDGEVLSAAGRPLKLAFDSLCVHGDEPTAVMSARSIRRAVLDAGLAIAPLARVVAARNESARISA